MSNEQILIDYEIIRKLDEQGQFGETYLAKDINLDKIIVVKEIPSFNIRSMDEFKEAKILHKANHKHVARVNFAGYRNKVYKWDDRKRKDAKNHDGKIIKHICLSMDYYENGSLERMLSNKTIKGDELLKIISHIIQGLHNIHSEGLVHHDIKPDNILFNDRWDAVISDFGVSEYLENDMLVRGAILPVLLYPPESMELYRQTGKVVTNQQSDIYQVGVLFYLMLRNMTFNNFAKEFRGLEREEIQRKIINGTLFNFEKLNNINKDLIKVLKNMLHKDPDKRYSRIIEASNKIAKFKSLY